jgi:hypothetical protein
MKEEGEQVMKNNGRDIRNLQNLIKKLEGDI